MEINIRTLRPDEFDSLHQCWLVGFGDYKVPLKLTKDDLITYLTQNGLDYSVSVGAFDGDKMVGFLVNGVRRYEGALTAYDTGTALVPEHRGSGLGGQMFAAVENILKENGIKRYQLEVITDNEPAYKLYLKKGFSVARNFECMKADDVIEPKNKPAGLSIRKVEFKDCVPLVNEMMEYKPSWQHTTEAISTMSRNITCLTANLNGKPVGYGFFQKTRKRILQIGATPAHRKNGIFEALIYAGYLEFNSEKDMAIINLTDEAIETTKALKSCGFKHFVSQYEMVKRY